MQEVNVRGLSVAQTERLVRWLVEHGFSVEAMPYQEGYAVEAKKPRESNRDITIIDNSEPPPLDLKGTWVGNTFIGGEGRTSGRDYNKQGETTNA